MQELLGHSDVSTTMIYTHVLKLGGGAVRSPLDALQPQPQPYAEASETAISIGAAAGGNAPKVCMPRVVYAVLAVDAGDVALDHHAPAIPSSSWRSRPTPSSTAAATSAS